MEISFNSKGWGGVFQALPVNGEHKVRGGDKLSWDRSNWSGSFFMNTLIFTIHFD